MKATFFHDCRLRYDESGRYYTVGGLNKDFLKNYLNYCEDLVLVTRKQKIESTKNHKYSDCDLEHVTFDGIDKLNFFSLLFGKSKSKISENLKNSDFAIIRLPSFIGYVAAYHANKMNKPYIVEVVGCPFNSLWYQGKMISKVIAPISYIIHKHLIQKAKNVIYVTEKFLQKKYPTKGRCMGCSDANIIAIEEKSLENRIYKIENLKQEDTIKFGLIGPLNVKYKGHKTAIKALHLIDGQRNFELHLLGSGDSSKIKKIATKYQMMDHIYFDGTLPGGDSVYQWMDKVDILLIPSLTEGLPRALIEAMTRASVTIGSNVGGIPELIGEEVTVKAKDYKQLAEKIETIIQSKEQMRNIAEKNYNKSLEFNKEVLFEKKDKFFKEFIEEIGDKNEKSVTNC